MCVCGGRVDIQNYDKNDENENFGAAAHGDWCHTCKSDEKRTPKVVKNCQNENLGGPCPLDWCHTCKTDEKCTAGPVFNGRRPRAAGLLSL